MNIDKRLASVSDLTDIVMANWRIPTRNVDEVYPRIFLGDEKAAKNVELLQKLGITHVLNAACGKGSLYLVDTSEDYYKGRNFSCKFMGLRAIDSATYNLRQHFNDTTAFIDDALNSAHGKVLVHCRQGISRSATLVIIFLMMKINMSAVEAVKVVRHKRDIFPNQGFLQQICDVDLSQRIGLYF